MSRELSASQFSTVTSGFFESFVEECSDPVLTIDESGVVVYANPATEAVLGYDPVKLYGQELATLIAADSSDERQSSLRKRLEDPTGIGDSGAIAFPVACGDERTVTFSVRFHRHGNGADADASGVETEASDTETVYTGVFRDGIAGPQRRDLETFRNLVEHAGHAIYVTDTEGTIEYINPAFTEQTGYDTEAAIGETAAILNSGEMPDAYFEALWTTLEAGEVWEEEIVDRKRDGELYHARQTIAPVIDDDGVVSRFVAIQTDITDRREAIARLKQYRDVVERLGEPIMLQNRDGSFEILNEAVSEFAGVDREALYETDEFGFMDPETAAEIDEHRREVLNTESVAEYEVSPTFPNSAREATFSTRRYPYYDAEGELAGTFAICRDMTEMKQREAELERYERAIDGATDLIAAVDENGRFLFANQQYREYHGIDVTEVSGLDLADAFLHESYPAVRQHVERALQGHSVEYRTERPHPERGTRTLDVRYFPLQDPDGDEPSAVVGVLRDVTEEESRRRQLRVVDRVLQHNLRNALTVISGRAAQIAAIDDEEIADAASDIVSRAEELSTTSEKAHHITEVLSDVTETESIDLTRTVEGIAELVAAEFPLASVSTSTPAEPAVASVSTWIDRAIDELVRNAIIHHDGDHPTVDVDVRTDAETITVVVTDDGPGLSEMNRDVLETGEAVDALYHGSGLGLWLVFWVLQQSGGSACVEPVDPRGTAVTITLPKARR